MSNVNTVQVGGRGLSLGMVLFIIFLVLKLTDNITWSWFYVTMPLWIVFPVMLAVFIVVGGFALAGGGIAWLIERFRR